MQKEITVREFEDAVSKIDDIEPMIVKRENKKAKKNMKKEKFTMQELFLKD